jgi:hypothetical protein
MKPGDIFYSPEFEFQDGSNKDKLLILLNKPEDCHACYFALATSRKKIRKDIPGCHSNHLNGYHFFLKTDDWFADDTWIIFKPIYEKPHSEVQDKYIYKGTLKENNFKALVKCIKACNDVIRRIKVLI